jgi:HTH-type transcriptional regulator, competence development regulator
VKSTLFVKFIYFLIRSNTKCDKIQIGDKMENLFGNRLRTLRKENKMTQKELANTLKSAESTVSMYERGEREPAYETVIKLSDIFNVSADYLLGRTDQRDGVINKTDKSKINEYNPLDEINKMVKEYGIEQMGFFDIEKWKKLGPDEIDEIRRHFEWVVQKAQQLEEEANKKEHNK